MNVFRQNEEQRARHDAQDAARRTETVERRSESAARLESDLNDFLRADFPTVLVSRADDALTITRTDGMTLVVTVLDNLYSCHPPSCRRSPPRCLVAAFDEKNFAATMSSSRAQC